MLFRYFRYPLFICLIPVFGIISNAQTGLCPPNLDFEQGDFTNWFCQTGSVGISAGKNHIIWSGVTVPVTERHTIISSGSGNDQYGGFPKLCPNGSGHSMMLGNANSGRQATSISYTYTIPSTVDAFSVLFHYAVVLQNPDHDAEQQPRFRARIIDLTTNTPLPCVTFDFTASSSLPGFKVSPSNPSVLYKDWTPISVNLTAYIGRTIMLEFISTDCTLGAHFGYAYVDVNSACNGAIGGSTICIGDTSITLTAPYGFQSYEWFADNTFSQSLSNDLTLTLDPPPVVGTIFPVVVEPFPGFGCNDTLYATISIAAKPVSNAGTDAAICKYQQTQVGGAPTPALAYSWTPANQVSNPFVAGPMAWNTIADSLTEFIVKTTDVLTGCYSFDTVIVSTKHVDTSVIQTGDNNYCFSGQPETTLSVNNNSTAIQWYDGNNPITNAVSAMYLPLTSGTYWAALTQNGCKDSTATHSIFVHPYPQASFYSDKDSGCVNTNSFVFTSTSSVSDGSSTSNTWQFSDGSLLQTPNAVKTFTNAGPANIKLIITTPFGCKDSTTKTIDILPNGVPDFSWDSICINRPVLFKNLSNQSGWPRANYSWNFNNGGAGSSVRNPAPVTFTDPGWVDVNLHMTIVGCENDPRVITKSVFVNKPIEGIKYKDITVPAGNSWSVHIRDTVGNIYNWRPQIYLSDYSKAYTRFFAVSDDVKYMIDITDGHTCVTTDTLQMLVLKKPGFYLPTAFSPNGDGLNDVIIPYLVGMKSLKSFTVYNRWGNRVFYTETMGKGWDGRLNGIDQPPGVYIWILEFITNDDKKVTEKGSVTIVR